MEVNEELQQKLGVVILICNRGLYEAVSLLFNDLQKIEDGHTEY